MNLPLFIARRYFLSKRKKNFINVISILSMIGIAFATAALIIVLSVFNGLEDLVRSLNASFDPELKIEPVAGKSFELTDSLRSQIESISGVEVITEVIEDYAYARYRNADMVVIIKGVSDSFLDQHRLDGHMIEGDLKLKEGDTNFAILGQGVSDVLSVAVGNEMYAMQLFYIRNATSFSIDPSRLYAQRSIRPAGIFAIEKTVDDNYVFIPLSFAQDLLNYGNKRTSLEIKTAERSSTTDVQRRIKEVLGTSFHVLTNEEQHQDIYRLLKIEKLFAFMSFALIMLIAAINIFFALSMLALDKRKDITILTAMGANAKLIKKTFLAEGALISFSGAITGLVLGSTICWLQGRFGLVGMGMQNAIVSAYPVKMVFSDLLFSSLAVIVVTLLVSIIPASKAAQTYTVTEL